MCSNQHHTLGHLKKRHKREREKKGKVNLREGPFTSAVEFVKNKDAEGPTSIDPPTIRVALVKIIVEFAVRITSPETDVMFLI